MTFLPPTKISSIAVVGAGTIGASWTAWFLARSCTVRVTDPDAARADFVRDYVRAAWPALARIGATREAEPAAALERLSFHAELEEAVGPAQFVQENAFERLDLKQDLLARIDAALGPDRVIASSTSGFGASELQQRMANPGRLVIGHPFNPPHLIPLVEVVGGRATDPAAVNWALAFYKAIGKRPIHIRKEVPAHLANRLQVALWREAVHLVASGVASVEDVDAAIAYGPGLRWALMGPHLTFHLGGGAGGMRHFVDHLGPPISGWWADLGRPELTPEIKDMLVAGVDEEIAGRSFETLVAERDRKLLDLLDVLGLARDET
jgi:carnitine 3-dehydrogenase